MTAFYLEEVEKQGKKSQDIDRKARIVMPKDIYLFGGINFNNRFILFFIKDFSYFACINLFFLFLECPHLIEHKVQRDADYQID